MRPESSISVASEKASTEGAMFSRGRDAIGVDVTHSGQFEARGALHGKVVLVADCTVCEKTNPNVCEVVARRHWIRLYGVRKSF